MIDIIQLFAFSVMPKPLMMKLVLAGQAKSLLPLGLDGIYHLQDELVNTHPFWNQVNGNNSIWFGKEDFIGFLRARRNYRYWHIGPKEHLGTNMGNILGPRGIDISPTRLTNGWRLYSNGLKEVAPFEITFQDQSPCKYL